MMVNLNRTSIFVLGTTFALGMALGWALERDRVGRKLIAVLADKLNDQKKEETA